MSDQTTSTRPSLQPLPHHDNVNTAHLLWKIAGSLTVTPTGCWEWQGRRLKRGYGRIGDSKKEKLVHRLVYELCVGDVPPGQEVCHECDNPPCCNPAHLFVGTRSVNLKDMAAKGRHNNPCPKGEKRPAPKLSDDAVRDIRCRAATGEKGIIARLAEEYGVSAVLVSQVARRHRHASVPDVAEGGAA